jgi:acetone carboxylase gamma subunit
MRLKVREVRGSAGAVHEVREWICPECDYFEEVDAAEG